MQLCLMHAAGVVPSAVKLCLEEQGPLPLYSARNLPFGEEVQFMNDGQQSRHRPGPPGCVAVVFTAPGLPGCRPRTLDPFGREGS